MSDCLFCKIIAGEIPYDKIYEDEKVLAFLDISPINPGHVLLIPKEHFDNTLETPDEILAYMTKIVKKIVPAIIKATGADAWNLGVNNGSGAGQIIFHTHWHIIPRLADDGLKHWPGKPYPKGENKIIAEKIKQNL